MVVCVGILMTSSLEEEKEQTKKMRNQWLSLSLCVTHTHKDLSVHKLKRERKKKVLFL